ncbi:MAG: metallophosphoesterase family protein [Acidobacteriales bacterium]|nr:metallophosphoesterase family protein [Terriglobales bacterium]
MRFAFVADIHGNLTALEAVIRDMHSQAPDAVYHVGDLAGLGRRPSVSSCVKSCLKRWRRMIAPLLAPIALPGSKACPCAWTWPASRWSMLRPLICGALRSPMPRMRNSRPSTVRSYPRPSCTRISIIPSFAVCPVWVWPTLAV